MNPLPRPAPEHAGSLVPYYNFWLGRVRACSIPPGAELVPQLREAFVAEGLPPGLVWLAEVESTFNPEACSPAGARGLFQLMPATAKELGLSTALPDERADPGKSARAAAHYLKQLHDQFGDWPLTLAAYNAGPGRIRRTLAAAGTDSFAAIAENLSAETRMYVPKVLATVEVRSGHPLAARPSIKHTTAELVSWPSRRPIWPRPLCNDSAESRLAKAFCSNHGILRPFRLWQNRNRASPPIPARKNAAIAGGVIPRLGEARAKLGAKDLPGGHGDLRGGSRIGRCEARCR